MSTLTLRFLFACVLLGTVGGCVSTDDYPLEWSTPESASGPQCPDIAGTYVSQAETLRPVKLSEPGGPKHITKCFGDDPPCFLDTLLHPDYKKFYHGQFKRYDVPLVELKPDETGGFTVNLIKNGAIDSSYRRESGNGRLECSNGAYEWSYGFVGAGGVGLGGGRESFTLRLAADRSLVVERRAITGGVFMLVIPLGGRENQWYRWRRSEER